MSSLAGAHTENRKAFRKRIQDFLVAQREAQTRFLAELVKVPSDNPPGDCRAHALRTRTLLEQLGFRVEAHAVPERTVRAAGRNR